MALDKAEAAQFIKLYCLAIVSEGCLLWRFMQAKAYEFFIDHDHGLPTPTWLQPNSLKRLVACAFPTAIP